MTLRLFSMFALSMLTMMPNLVAQEDGDRPRRERNRGGEREGNEGDRQRPDGPRGPGGFRGPGGPGGGMMGMMGGMMGGMGGSGASQLLGMLRMEEVRKELGMSDEAFEAVQASQQETFSMMRGLRDASDEERKEIMEKMNTSAQELLDEVLPPEKQKRLLGLMVQLAGAPAVLNDQVSKEIGLTSEVTQAIQKDLEAFGEKMRDRFVAMREEGGFGDFAKIQEDLKAAREELDELILSKLTDDQKSALESIKGEKVELPALGMFQGGMGRGNRPPRGEGDQGGRGRRGGQRD